MDMYKNTQHNIKITRDYVQIKTILPQNMLRILYNSLVLPHLQYCELSWLFKSDRIFKLQKELFELLHAVSIMPLWNHYWNA